MPGFQSVVDSSSVSRVSYLNLDYDFKIGKEHLAIVDSVALNNWRELMKYRENHRNNLGAKLLAELGFLGNGLFSILETGVRLPISYVVGNYFSQYIAKIINFCKKDEGRTLEEYKQLRRRINRSVGKSIESIAHSFTSVGTNLVSHDLQCETAAKIQSSKITDAVEIGDSFIENVLSPAVILKGILRIPPKGSDMILLLDAELREAKNLRLL